MPVIPGWISDAPVPLDSPEEASRPLLERLADVQLCESCRARSLEPLCPACLEMALRELEARAEAGEDL